LIYWIKILIKMRGNIYKINEFLDINEGILSSITSTLSKILGGKKGKIEEILKKIKNAKSEEIKEIVEIEKKLYEYSGFSSAEKRFQIQNLNKQLRNIISLKEKEIQSYIKDLDKISKNNTQLEALVSSELAKIQVEASREMIKKISPYKDENHLQTLNREFNELVKSATEKELDLEKELGDPYFSQKNIDVNDDIVSFVDLDSQSASFYLKNVMDSELDRMHKELTDWRLKLEIEISNKTSPLKKKIEKIEKEGPEWAIPQIEAELLRITYRSKKSIDKIRSKIQIIEKEIKNRKYETA